MHRLRSFWTGVALTGLGVSLTMLGVGGLLESRWVGWRRAAEGGAPPDP